MGRWQQQAQTRAVRSAGGKARQNRFACVALALLAALGTWGYAKFWLASLDFYRHATPTTATLENEYTENRTTRHGATTSSYSVRYSYIVGGATYTGADTIDEQPTPTMTVYYHPQRPAESRIEYAGHFAIESVFMAIVAGAVVVFAILARVYHRRAQAIDQAEATAAA